MKLLVICTLCYVSIALASIIRDETEAFLELVQNEIERKGRACLGEGSRCDPGNDECCKDQKCVCDSGKKKKKDKKDKKDKKNKKDKKDKNDSDSSDSSDTDSGIPVKWTCYCDLLFKG